jgi:hypothetical protein
MNEKEKPVLYRPMLAIDHVQTLREFIPLRLFAVLFPLWRVEVAAIQPQNRPYEMIERYLERGIVEGQLCTVGELAAFFHLSRALVEKVLASLQAIGHVTSSNGMLILTDLGYTSLQAGQKGIIQQKAHILYFDGFQIWPLLREHYHSKSIRILDELEADAVTERGRGGYQFQRLYSAQPWNRACLFELERHPDRARYNLPEEWSNLRDIGVTRAYLPMYLIKARKRSPPSSEPYYVTYTRVRGRRDEFLERIVNENQEIRWTLNAEEEFDVEELWSQWLIGMGLSYLQPQRTPQGLWRVDVPAQVFHSSNTILSVASIGTYHLERGYILQIWCTSQEVRSEAVLDRILKIIEVGQQTMTRQQVLELLQYLSELLDADKLSLQDIYRQASKRNMDRALLNTIAAWRDSSA